MAQISFDTDSTGSDSPVSLELANQPTVEQEDRNFIAKVIEHIRTLPGDTEKLKVQTNTKFPSRYVLMLTNLPAMKYEDFITIQTLAPRLRNISVSLKDKYIKIDMWKNGAAQKKTKRKFHAATTRKWNLKTIPKTDKNMLERILDGLTSMPSLPCQFHVDVESKPPNYYYLNVITNDIMAMKELIDFKHTHRAFVKEIDFLFPSNTIRFEIEKASALTEAAVGQRRQVVVYKKQKI
jgi:hypothetical protein